MSTKVVADDLEELLVGEVGGGGDLGSGFVKLARGEEGFGEGGAGADFLERVFDFERIGEGLAEDGDGGGGV